MRNPVIDVTSLLAHQPLFMGLPEDNLRQLSGRIREKRLGRGETLFHRGAPAGDGFWVIVLGQIKLAFPANNGNEKVLATLVAKQSFGEAQMLLGESYPYYAEALADSLLLRVDRDVYSELYEQAHPLVRGLLDNMAARIQYLVQDIEHISTHSGAERVVAYLLRQCPEEEDPEACEQGSYTISLPMTKQLLASRLNLKPETLSRIFHDLTAEGLIRVEGKTITIHDRERLRRFG
jgi:CRP/FNR family transcriptional regulator, dissimilatory nitrate respiration regulator